MAGRGNSRCWGTFIEKAQEGPVGREFSVNQSNIYMLDKVSLNRNEEDRHLLIGG